MRLGGRAGVLMLVVVAFAGCGSGEEAADRMAREEAPDEPVATVEEADVEDGDIDATDLPLEEVGGSGVRGVARVGPAEGEAIAIEVELAQASGTHGIEARMGSCADALSSDAAEDLVEGATSYTLADIEEGTMRDEATLPDELVSEGTYSLVVYVDADVDGEVAACADVEVQ